MYLCMYECMCVYSIFSTTVHPVEHMAGLPTRTESCEREVVWASGNTLGHADNVLQTAGLPRGTALVFITRY